MELLIASRNVHKIRELRELLKADKELKGLDILSLLNFKEYKPPLEDGISFQENAEIKALDAAKKLNKWVLADDSGLIVPKLQGEPGVFSARYAGSNATDSENRQKLLLKMQGLKDFERNCYFECWLTLASPKGIQKSVCGKCEGLILIEERGRNGFGYDSLFIKHDYDKTFAELDEQTKNKISHRRKALEKMLPSLKLLKN